MIMATITQPVAMFVLACAASHRLFVVFELQRVVVSVERCKVTVGLLAASLLQEQVGRDERRETG